MNITLPGNPIYDIASTTSAMIAPYAGVMALSVGIFVGLFVIQFLIMNLATQTGVTGPVDFYPMPPDEV